MRAQTSARVMGSRLWDTWRRHFRLRAVTPPLPYLDAGRRVLCCQFPCAAPVNPLECPFCFVIQGFSGASCSASTHVLPPTPWQAHCPQLPALPCEGAALLLLPVL